MSLLDSTKIGNFVQINIALSRDRLTKDIIDAINVSSVGKISGYKITDGKGIGVVIKLSNGKKQWFFEDEINLLDENGNLIERIKETKESSSLTTNILSGLKYENKNNVSELLNPINFFLWLAISLKDIF